MIENKNSNYELTCDICGYSVTGCDTFQEAVDYKKENGWKSQKVSDGWDDVCPDCQ